MVFTSLDPARDTYRLWHRFHMPTAGGSKDAVAVSQNVGDQLVSAYTFILQHIVLLVWGITLLAALLTSSRRYERTHPNSVLHKEIWHNRSSPFNILKLAFKHFLKPKSNRWFILLWLLMALSFVVVKYAVPIVFSPYIKIAYAAPVSPDAIYVPSTSGANVEPSTLESDIETVQIYQLGIPAALRAAGGVDGANATFNKKSPVKVDQQILGTDAAGEQLLRIDYAYNVTGLDFGLQHHPDLTLTVEGSCTTEYGWWNGSGTLDSYPGAFVEVYNVFDSSDYQVFVSKYDGGPPIATFIPSPPTDASNSTWGAVISSVNRTSYTVGTDPWYKTGNNPFYNATTDPDLAVNMVLPQRPALSCWENDVWSYRGQNSSIANLQSIPGLNLPDGLLHILNHYLGGPVIVTLGSSLRQSALKSSFTSLDDIFDAKSSSIYSDFQRLVLASYIATANTFTETTLYPPNGTIPNDVLVNGTLYSGTSDFVIFSNNVVALSVKSLIVVPTIAVLLWIIFILLMLLPSIVGLVEQLAHGEKHHQPIVLDEAKRVAEPVKEKAKDVAYSVKSQDLGSATNISV